MDLKAIHDQNLLYTGTNGVSQENRKYGFIPAFRDESTGRVEIARFLDGKPAPLHLITALPDEWVVARDESGGVCRVKGSVVAGFVRDSKFYTRQEASDFNGSN